MPYMFIPIVWLVTWVMNICNYFTIINYNLTDEIKSKAFIQIRILIYAKVFIVENKTTFKQVFFSYMSLKLSSFQL